MRLRRTKGNGGGKDHPRPRRLGGCTLGRHGALHGSGGCAAAAYRHTECTCRAFVRTWCSCVNAGSARARPQSCRRGLLRAGFPLRALDRVEHHLGGLACCSMALGIGLHEFLTESKAWLTGMEVGGGLRNESRSKGRQAKNGPLAFPPPKAAASWGVWSCHRVPTTLRRRLLGVLVANRVAGDVVAWLVWLLAVVCNGRGEEVDEMGGKVTPGPKEILHGNPTGQPHHATTPWSMHVPCLPRLSRPSAACGARLLRRQGVALA